MNRFSVYYALAVIFAAAGLLLEDSLDGEITFWPLIVLALVAFLGAVGIGFGSKRT
jgi:hypothetical protein